MKGETAPDPPETPAAKGDDVVAVAKGDAEVTPALGPNGEAEVVDPDVDVAKEDDVEVEGPKGELAA